MFFSIFQNLWQPLLIAAALIGAVIGALFYAGISAFLNRQPAVGRRIDILPNFEDLYGVSLRSKLILSDGESTYSYSNLYPIQIEISNRSRQNFDEFEFGITLPVDHTIIYTEVQPIDRHHRVKQVPASTFTNPTSRIDLILQPFNREDIYKLRLLVNTTKINSSPEQVSLSSSEAIRFVDMPTTQKTMEKAAKSVSLPLGLFKISFR